MTEPRSGSGATVVDCVVSLRTRRPVDRMGRRLPESGRWLILDTVAALRGTRELTGRDLARDEHRRWSLPEHGLHVSVAHADDLAVVAVADDGPVGADVQDVRDRPLAMAWLGELLALADGAPATIRDFAECEALIKASHLTKETFAGVRLPAWRPGWRRGNAGYHHLSTPVGPGAQLALATSGAPTVRWWWHVRGSATCHRTTDVAVPPADLLQEAIAC